MHKVFFTFSILLFVNSANSSSLVQEFTSPFVTPAKKVFWTGVITTGVTFVLLEDKIYGDYQKELVDCELMGENTNRYFDLFGQGVPNIIYAWYWYFHGGSKKKAMHMVRSTLNAVALTTMLKHTIRQRRPGNSDNRDSFPSGHTTSAFAFASVVASNHSKTWGAVHTH